MKEEFVSRRKFIKTASLGTAAVATGITPVFANGAMTPQTPLHKGSILQITPEPAKRVFKPLDVITVSGFKKGTVRILDGNGNLYAVRQVDGAPFSFRAGGALGIQTVLYLNGKQQLEDWTSFKVDAKTEIKDKGSRYEKLLATLYWSMIDEIGTIDSGRYNGKIYAYFVCWLRDHVHAMKGMKYFFPNLRSAIDLYAEYQRADGMVYDNIYKRAQGHRPTYWEKRFNYGNFMEIADDGMFELKRIPVENDVEYLFLEGIYYTWKATGDTEWMKGLLDRALKAVEYSTTSPYRWSEKYQLLKRGFTIDTWDFQSSFDLPVVGGDIMVIDKDKTEFGIMYGDNTGMAIGLAFLAEMLAVAGRADDAKRMKQLEKDIRERLDRLAWNGEYFRHHIPENPHVVRDTGTDPEIQVSLSNAYSLNRGITHGQAVAIIKTYQRIRREMPESSPGEWFGIYPPFERGFEGHSDPWDYVNGGVLSIVAGELAHGAFEHGYETYGVETLNRLADIALTTNDYLHCTYRGALPDKPVRNFTTLSLAKVANGSTHIGDTAREIRGFDLRNLPLGQHSYEDIPFDVTDPATNDGKNCLVLSGSGAGYASQIIIPVNRKTVSIYFLHLCAGGTDVGTVTCEYQDGSTAIDYINNTKISHWYLPDDNAGNTNHRSMKMKNLRLGWWGVNADFTNVGCVVYGYNNPNPDREIKNIRFDSFKNRSTWGILAVTLCDSRVFFMPITVSFGIPDGWGAAAVTYALIEGLAGVKDAGVSFDKVRFAPRWEAAGLNEVEATVKYEASGGYVSYKYSRDGDVFNILVTGNGTSFQTELLLPKNTQVKSVTVNGASQPFTIRQVEESAYCCFTLDGIGVKDIIVEK